MIAKMIANTPRIASTHQLPIRTLAMPALRDRILACCDRELRRIRRFVEALPLIPGAVGYRRARRNRVSAFSGRFYARGSVALISEATRELVDGIAAEAERCETPCGDGSMVWHCWGSGLPLVLLHGGYGSWSHWIRNVLPLSRSFRVIPPDPPGLG